MARRGKISEIYDLEKIEAQQKVVINLVGNLTEVLGNVKPIAINLSGAEKTKEVIDGMKAVSKATEQVSDISNKTTASLSQMMDMSKKVAQGFSELGTSYDDNIKKQLQLKARLQELKKTMEDLNQFKGIGGDGATKIAEQIAAITKEEQELKQQLSTVNTAIKAQVKEMQAMPGSIDEARAKLKLLRIERNNLDLSTDSGQAMKTSLNAQIDLLDEFVRKENDAYTQRKINIGNYQGSAKIIVDALKKVEDQMSALQQKQQGLQNLSKSDPIGFKFGKGREELNQVNAQLETTQKEFQALNTITSNPQFFNIAGKAGDANAELRQFTKTLIELERQGLGSTEFANDLRKNMAELKDGIEDTRQEIKAMSSDSRTFDQVASSVSFLANTYQTVVGAQALFGEQNEANEETLKKLMAVQAFANGLQEISTQLTQRGTLVNKAYAFVQELLATAMDKTAAASVRAAAATKLLLGGIVLGALVYLVVKMQEWSKAASDVVSKQKVLNQVTRAAADSYGQEKAQLDLLIASITREGVSRKEKFATLKELQEKYPGYFDNIKTEKDLNEKLAGAYERAAQGILLKAQAQAAGDLLAENTSKRLKAELDYREKQEKSDKEYERGLTFVASRGKEAVDAYTKSYKNLTKISAESYSKQIADIDKTNKFLIQSVQDANSKILTLGGTTSTKKTDTKDKPAKNDQVEKDLKARFELYKIGKEREIAGLLEVAKSEEASYSERLLAAMSYIKEKQKLIRDNAEFEKKTNKLSKDESALVDEKSRVEQIDIADEGEKIILEVKKKYLAEKIKLNAAESANYSFTYNKLKAALDDYAKKQLEIAALEKKLHEERRARIKDFVLQMADATFQVFTFSIDSEKNRVEEQASLLEERKNKEIETANATIANADERERAIVEIEARSAAQKEQLSRKQKSLDVQKAKIEKASAIFSIGIAALQKVFEIKAQAAVLLANPLTAFLAPIALAQIPIVLLSAGLAAGLVAAKPIPKFAAGTDDHDGGLAIVGDGGKKEYVQTPDGNVYETPATDTVVDLPKHSKVFKDEFALMDAMHAQFANSTLAKEARTPNDVYQFQNITKSIERMENSVVRAIQNQPQPVIQAVNPVKKWVHSSGSTEFL